MSLFWLSFCDPGKPAGSQFLGVAIVEGGDSGDTGDDLIVATRNAWARGCNPGGQVRGVRVPVSMVPHIGPQWRYRLLSKAECAEFDRQLKPFGVS